MKTTIIKTAGKARCFKPKSGYTAIQINGNGDLSGMAFLNIELKSYINTPPSVEDRTIRIEGGVFTVGGVEMDSYEWVPSTNPIGVRVTGEARKAFIYISLNARISLREMQTENISGNTPLVDWANSIFTNFNDYVVVFSGNKRFITDISGLRGGVHNKSLGVRGMFENSNLDAVPYMDTSGVTNFNNLLWGALYFNSTLEHLDFSEGTGFENFLRNARSFNQFLPQTFENAISMALFASDAVSFNQDVSHFQVSNCTNMRGMWSRAYSFDQDLSSWDFNLNVNLSGFVDDSGLSPKNLSKLYIALANRDWSGRTEVKVLGARNVKYDGSGASARQMLVDNGWTITDGGEV